MNKFRPFRGCSYRACKRGKTKHVRKMFERKLRRTVKIELKTTPPEDFDNKKMGIGYTD